MQVTAIISYKTGSSKKNLSYANKLKLKETVYYTLLQISRQRPLF